MPLVFVLRTEQDTEDETTKTIAAAGMFEDTGSPSEWHFTFDSSGLISPLLRSIFNPITGVSHDEYGGANSALARAVGTSWRAKS
jgi:hypothetical protein